jgi:hypothetical protein
MARKHRDEGTATGKGEKAVKGTVSFLSAVFPGADTAIVKQHLRTLIVASLLVKLAVFLCTQLVFNSFIDSFDLQFYFEHGVKLLNGQLPYVSFDFDYPVLIFIPIGIALIPAVLFRSIAVFLLSFQLLMVLCDCVTLLCVYFIALKLFNEKAAFLAGILYATAFSSAYFVITKYDAFPTCLLMLAVFFTVCGMNLRGYLAAGLGFFAKIFPAIAFPFLILHNAKKTSLQGEIIAVLKIMVPLAALLLLPVLVVRPGAIRTYLFATGASVGVYVNTVTYTLYSWLHGVGTIGIAPETLSLGMYGLMGVTLLYLVYSAYTDTEKRPVTLLKTLLCAFIAVIFFTKFHSPQYIVWFTPFLCLLVIDDLVKILLFYVVQVFGYIEFPLMFGSYYTNLEYTNAAGSPGWYITLIFFTLQYLALLILVILIVRPPAWLPGLLRKEAE